MSAPDGFDGFRCLCGQWVAVIHKECAAMADTDSWNLLERLNGFYQSGRKED